MSSTPERSEQTTPPTCGSYIKSQKSKIKPQTSFPRLFHTLRHLRPRQITYQLYYRLTGRLTANGARTRVRGRAGERGFLPPLHDDLKAVVNALPVRLDEAGFCFLNRTVHFGPPAATDWNHADHGKLWTYNLNYFEFLRQPGLDPDRGEQLIAAWVTNEDSHRDGWEPYPTSLRLVNWLQFYRSHGRPVPAAVHGSVRRQYNSLRRKIEYHLGGNHLLENALALALTARYLGDAAGQQQADKLLRAELAEQYTPAGGHYERSVMYHLILLWRQLDLLSWLVSSSAEALGPQGPSARPPSGSDLLIVLTTSVRQQLAWAEYMITPDGRYPHFNDSVGGIAPEWGSVRGYAEALGLGYARSARGLTPGPSPGERGDEAARSARQAIPRYALAGLTPHDFQVWHWPLNSDASDASDARAQRALPPPPLPRRGGRGVRPRAERADNTSDTRAQRAGNTSDTRAERADNTSDTRAQRAGNTSDTRAQRADNTSDTRAERADNTSDARAERADNTSDTRAERADNISDTRAERADNTSDARAQRADNSGSISKIKNQKSKVKNHRLWLNPTSLTPAYLPGHAHADSLSFVLHAAGEPLIVDTAVSTYEKNDRRAHERSTAAHNTVTVGDDLNSSDVWGGFRVGRRATTTVVDAGPDRLTAYHDGFPGTAHQRSFALDRASGQLTITDQLKGRYESGIARFHFAPGQAPALSGDTLSVDDAVFTFTGATALALTDYQAAVGWNTLQTARVLAVSFTGALTTTIDLN